MTNKTDSGEWVVIERTLEAPIALVWKMWTEPEHFKSWYGPQGASVPVADMDVRVGGSRLVCMEMDTPNGPMSMWFTGEYREVSPPNRLVYSESMSDEHGNVKTPEEMGFPPDHPGTTEIVVELSQDGDRTNMVMTHVGIPEGSPAAGGWAMAFDKLEDHLGATHAPHNHH